MNACTSAIALLTNPQWIEITKLAVSVLTLVSIVIAYLSYRTNLKKLNDDRVREIDKELLAQAKQSLHWAYDVLTENGRSIPPQANRLNWLTCARHLRRALDISKHISGSTYKTVYAEIEEYWRHMFYTSLDHESLRGRRYFEDPSDPEWPENIEITSALVIANFSAWNKATVDPLDSVVRQDLMNPDNGFRTVAAGRGLESYIVHFEEIKAQRRNVEGASVAAEF
jgi:hypothetical protein